MSRSLLHAFLLLTTFTLAVDEDSTAMYRATVSEGVWGIAPQSTDLKSFIACALAVGSPLRCRLTRIVRRLQFAFSSLNDPEVPQDAKSHTHLAASEHFEYRGDVSIHGMRMPLSQTMC